MTPSPIHRALSSIHQHGVRYLLMGGQACVLYGGAEFSRDLDLAIDPDPKNLARLKLALDELKAERIAVPPFSAEVLSQGHAVHFRSRHPDTTGLRIDVMTRMRGVEEFERLWARRTTVEAPDPIEVMALSDLVRAKKTQRDKDWPMIRRLLEADYLAHRDAPDAERVEFWLRELRTPEFLVEVIRRFPEASARLETSRPALAAARRQDTGGTSQALREEEERERELDREYWAPLRKDLERLRHERLREDPS